MNCALPTSPDAAPAQILWVQLATRVTACSLHYRSGDEETAAESVYNLFKTVRELLEKHPHAEQFRDVSLTMLNGVIRPYTGRWHGWMAEERKEARPGEKPAVRFRDEQVRRLFRSELQELKARLDPYLKMLGQLAQSGPRIPAEEAEAATEKALGKELANRLRMDRAFKEAEADLGADLDAGVGGQVSFAKGISVAEINQLERWRIANRRALLEGKPVLDESETKPPANPPPIKNAIGLALSGGGIRSATFCLGIVQVLARKNLLLPFDYLSTVSGGGYIGSFLSCALGTLQPGAAGAASPAAAAEKIRDIFLRQDEHSRQKGIESGLVRHLRNNSKYLLHGGFLGTMRILGLMLSGLVWNTMMLLPVPLFAALAVYGASGWFWGQSVPAALPAWPAVTGSAAGWMLTGLSVLLVLAWIPLPGIQLWTHGSPPKSRRALLRSLWENATLGLGLATALAGVIYLIPALFNAYEWVRLKLSAIGLAGMDLKDLSELVPASVTGAASAVLAGIGAWLSPRWPRLRGLVVKLFILTGPLLMLSVFLLVGNRLGLARAGVSPWNSTWVLVATAGLAAWSWFLININTLGPHRYYRNRLCECYLARRIPAQEGRTRRVARAISGETVQGTTEQLKQVKLSELGTDRSAPYHLVNMTINAPTSDNKDLRGRGGDFFVASRHVCGSPLTGYARTEDVERVDPHFDLGTAMAVSAAAASTNMGWQTVPHFRFLMALFNVRLGYWLRHPARPAAHRFLSGAGPGYLFREATGRIDERSRYVNLSDGGHIENLAAYELLRRRCKFIVCVDAGCEPGMYCADLIRLQRYAEIDLGIRMHFNAGDLQPGVNDLSRAHAILVKIDYEPEPTRGKDSGRTSNQLGWMLYLKLAVTGIEPAYVKDYRRQNPDFPHESTGDQIYDEAQFEAYRALGECAMEDLFRKELVGAQPPGSVRAWFQCLANNLLPDNDPVFRRKES